MRFVAPLLMVLATAAYGCASSNDDASTGDEAISAASGTACRVIYEDNDVVVFRAPAGATSYVPKVLHVTDVRATPAAANLASDLSASRFAASHVDYVLAPRAQNASIVHLAELVGPSAAVAPTALDPTTGTVAATTALGAPTFSTPDNGATIVAELTAPAGGDATAFMTAATTKASLTNAKVTANVSCGGGTMTVTMTTQTQIAFDVAQAKVMTAAAPDLAVLDTFMSLSAQIESGAFSEETTKLASTDLTNQLTSFAALVDAKLAPFVQSYGVTTTRTDLQTAATAVWSAYLDLAQAVLTATQSTATTATMQVQNADGSYSLAPTLSADAQTLLATADTARKNVELLAAETGTGWTTQPLR